MPTTVRHAPSSIDLLMNLEQGCCLLKIGNKPAVLMRASRSSIEAQLADTDGALLSQARVGLQGDDFTAGAQDDAEDLALAGAGSDVA